MINEVVPNRICKRGGGNQLSEGSSSSSIPGQSFCGKDDVLLKYTLMERCNFGFGRSKQQRSVFSSLLESSSLVLC